MTATIAELKNVTKTFGDKTALDNISLQIHEGEILGLLGPNGSGKTTLLKTLAFLESPSRGEVLFRGKNVGEKDMEQLRMETTMVFQKTILFNTTVYNNVAYGLKIRKFPKTEMDEKVVEALEIVKLKGFEKRQARKLSGGEQQRVALARALALNTRLLLLDEPTANLDPKNASIIEEIIAEANRQLRTTIVLATHNMFQARNLPQRIALMTNGKIDEVGAPAEIFDGLSKTLAAFAAVENTFAGTAKITANGTTLVDIGENVTIEMSTKEVGEVAVFVSPADIILSRTRFESSARNVFKGKITEILDKDSLVKLKVDVGKLFTVQITKRSFNEMQLNIGTEVFLTFKASSVQTI
jgi:tungstate transport system ATP-binding protein